MNAQEIINKFKNKKFYLFDVTDGKYFEDFGSRHGKKTTYWSNSPYGYPVGYTTMKKVEEVLGKIMDIRTAKADHEYEVRDFQEYERTYWEFGIGDWAVPYSSSVKLKIKDIIGGKMFSTDSLECALYHEQN